MVDQLGSDINDANNYIKQLGIFNKKRFNVFK